MKSLLLIMNLAWLLVFLQFSEGFVHNIIGTPFLYTPTKYEVDPSGPARNARNYQELYGYRAAKFLESLNQTVVENNPRLYDVEDSTKVYRYSGTFS